MEQSDRRGGSRPECAGEHEFYEHDHSHVPGEHRWQRCSGRFWCQRCERWFTGELCDPASMGPPPKLEADAEPLLVAADLA